VLVEVRSVNAIISRCSGRPHRDAAPFSRNDWDVTFINASGAAQNLSRPRTAPAPAAPDIGGRSPSIVEPTYIPSQMDMSSHSPRRMVEIIAALSVFGDVLTDLIVKLASATPNEIPELRAQAEALTQRVTECCADTAPVDHLAPEEVTEIRSEMVRLAEAMKAQIANIVDLRLTSFTGSAVSRTRH
jgi:hypothetical protein